MEFKYNKDEIKEKLTIEQISDLLVELGGEPIIKNNIIISKTICHCGNSHKLYYYDNTKLFRCYTECEDSVFDIYELVKKVKSREYGKDIDLFWSIQYVASYFGYNITEGFEKQQTKIEDWEIFNNYERIKNFNIDNQIVELKVYDKNVLDNLPHPIIRIWEKEGITKEAMKKANIAYNPSSQGIIIPHYDIENNLIGIRERTLIKEKEKNGKYKPAILNGKMYNHPLGFALYNLNNSKDNIKQMKKAIVYEGEKSCLLYMSYFGINNDISCACCGSSLINYQIELLLSLGVEEIIVGFDKQFKEIGDDEFKHWTKKLENFNTKYKNLVNMSFLFDKKNLLNYKDSPLDQGPEVFLKLFNERVII